MEKTYNGQTLREYIRENPDSKTSDISKLFECWDSTVQKARKAIREESKKKFKFVKYTKNTNGINKASVPEYATFYYIKGKPFQICLSTEVREKYFSGDGEFKVYFYWEEENNLIGIEICKDANKTQLSKKETGNLLLHCSGFITKNNIKVEQRTCYKVYWDEDYKLLIVDLNTKV